MRRDSWAIGSKGDGIRNLKTRVYYTNRELKSVSRWNGILLQIFDQLWSIADRALPCRAGNAQRGSDLDRSLIRCCDLEGGDVELLVLLRGAVQKI